LATGESKLIHPYQVISLGDPEERVTLKGMNIEAEWGEDSVTSGLNVGQVAHEGHYPGPTGVNEPARTPVVNVCLKNILKPWVFAPFQFLNKNVFRKKCVFSLNKIKIIVSYAEMHTFKTNIIGQ